MASVVVAEFDAALRATIVQSHNLHYAAGADPSEDRPVHVRAGSSLTVFRGQLAVIQDDAHFIAFLDADTLEVTACALPRGEQGHRQFDDLRGNKRFKLDLEAATVVPTAQGEALLALGSGSKRSRESAVLVSGQGAAPELVVQTLPDFYSALRAAAEFAGSELNVEGALYLDGWIRLFNRGNGKVRAGRTPVNATADLRCADLLRHIADPHAPLPQLSRITQYDLGEIEGVPLTFTDATVRDRAILNVATAECSPDAVLDGPVAGSAIGLIRGDRARWGKLFDPTGRELRAKVEGVCGHPSDEDRLFILLDRDEPQRAAELCELQLTGS